MFRKTVSRRFSWCNSQIVTPSRRRAMKETVFVPFQLIWYTRDSTNIPYP